MPELIDRKQAHERGLVRYFTGFPCRKGHVTERYVSNGVCSGCLKAFSKFAPNPYTKQLVAWSPSDKFHVPHTMTPQHFAGLEAYLYDCVDAWLAHQGMLTQEMRDALDKLDAYRKSRSKVTP